ncbi:MAG: alpha-E domain-containing protein, partial [Deltaproteobacteria bacterium]|nr:alpha-E domain-containing protein [Deltaproteobacteria bacterium]
VLLSELVLLFSALAGASHESMIHGPGWRFLDLGRRVERLHHTARVLAAVLAPGTRPDGPTLEALLEAAESIITYRNRYVGALALAPVLDLLVTDESNPRSLAYQLVKLDEHVKSLPRATRDPLRPEEVRLVLGALSRVQLLDVHALAPETAIDAPASLAGVLGDLARTALTLADALTRAYLTHAEPSQSVDGLS